MHFLKGLFEYASKTKGGICLVVLHNCTAKCLITCLGSPDPIYDLSKGGEVWFANRSRTPNARTERPVRFGFGLGAEPFGAFGFGVRWIPKISEPVRTEPSRGR